jgi:hypothetical protein
MMRIRIRIQLPKLMRTHANSGSGSAILYLTTWQLRTFREKCSVVDLLDIAIQKINGGPISMCKNAVNFSRARKIFTKRSLPEKLFKSNFDPTHC